jgi:hypothetical protein
MSPTEKITRGKQSSTSSIACNKFSKHKFDEYAAVQYEAK